MLLSSGSWQARADEELKIDRFDRSISANGKRCEELQGMLDATTMLVHGTDGHYGKSITTICGALEL
jgi:hypothetical protein